MYKRLHSKRVHKPAIASFRCQARKGLINKESKPNCRPSAKQRVKYTTRIKGPMYCVVAIQESWTACTPKNHAKAKKNREERLSRQSIERQKKANPAMAATSPKTGTRAGWPQATIKKLETRYNQNMIYMNEEWLCSSLGLAWAP